MKTLRSKPLGSGNLNRPFESKLDNLQALLSKHGINASILEVRSGVVTLSACPRVDLYIARSLLKQEGYDCVCAAVL